MYRQTEMLPPDSAALHPGYWESVVNTAQSAWAWPGIRGGRVSPRNRMAQVALSAP